MHYALHIISSLSCLNKGCAVQHESLAFKLQSGKKEVVYFVKYEPKYIVGTIVLSKLDINCCQFLVSPVSDRLL